MCCLPSPAVCPAAHTSLCIPQCPAGPVWLYPAPAQVSSPLLAKHHGPPGLHPHWVKDRIYMWAVTILEPAIQNVMCTLKQRETTNPYVTVLCFCSFCTWRELCLLLKLQLLSPFPPSHVHSAAASAAPPVTQHRYADMHNRKSKPLGLGASKKYDAPLEMPLELINFHTESHVNWISN